MMETAGIRNGKSCVFIGSDLDGLIGSDLDEKASQTALCWDSTGRRRKFHCHVLEFGRWGGEVGSALIYKASKPF